MFRKEYKGAKIMNKGTVKAVHDSDIEKLLISLGCYEGVLDGQKECNICGRKITLENILAVFPEKEEVCFCCDDPKCYAKLLKRGGMKVD